MNIKKMKSLIIIYFIINLFLVITLTGIFNLYESYKALFLELSPKSETIDIHVLGKMDYKKIMQSFESEDGIIVKYILSIGEFNEGKSCYGIYYNDKVFNEPPTFDGDYISKEDIKKNLNYAVIGKNMRKFTYLRNNELYLKINGVEFKVKGFLGYKDKESSYDDIAVINLRYLFYNVDNNLDLVNPTYEIDNVLKDNDNSFENISKELHSNFKNIKVKTLNKNKSNNLMSMAISMSKRNVNVFFLILISLIINITNISIFYVNAHKRLIGVQKAYGATNLKIFKKFLISYECAALISFILAMVVGQVLAIKLNIRIYNVDSYIKLMILTFVFSSLIGIISSIVSIRSILKLEPKDIIRG